MLTQADVKNPARGHKVEKHHPEGRNVRRTLHIKRKRQWYQKYSEKAASPNKQKEKTKKHVWLSGRLHVGGQLNKGRGFNESIKTKTKLNKIKVTPEKDVMASANQTPGGYKFASIVARQQGRDQHEPACFGLSSPWPFPSR